MAPCANVIKIHTFNLGRILYTPSMRLLIRFSAGLCLSLSLACSTANTPTGSAAKLVSIPDAQTATVNGVELRVTDLGAFTEADGTTRARVWVQQGHESHEVFEGDTLTLNGARYGAHLDLDQQVLQLRLLP